MEVISNVVDWLPWLASGGALSYGALAIFAPSALQVIVPVIKALLEGTIEYIRTLWSGAMDMIDNAASVVFVATMMGVAFLYGGDVSVDPTSKTITKIEKCSCPKAKVSEAQPYFTNPLDWLGRH